MTDVYWLTQRQSDVPDGDSWLSVRERAVAARMYFEKRRQDWKLGRWTAKLAVLRQGRRPSHPGQAARLEIIAAPDGAPEAFLDGASFPVSLSISHSSAAAFCAVASPGLRLGCDLEEIHPLEANFAADYFTSEELEAVEAIRAPERDERITLIWSAKESVLKATREGLRRDTRSVQVVVCEEGVEWHPFQATDLESSRPFQGWWRVTEGLVHTIAADIPTNPPIALLRGL